MRRRVLATYLSLLAAVVCGLAVPLAAQLARDATHTAYLDRHADTARFASLAEPVLLRTRTDALRAELRQYQQLYGISALIVDESERIVLASDPGAQLADEPALADHVRTGLSGGRSGSETVVWPWTTGPLVVTEPVTSNGIVIGVAVTVSPTADLRRHVLQRWALLALVGLLALLAGLAPAARITRWVLRPIERLDEVTHKIAGGRLDARVATDQGPPELRRLGRSFNTMADATAALLEQQRTFVSHASHQLRTPLATLRLRVETLADHLRPGGTGAHALTLGEVDRLGALCHNLLSLARAESGRQQVVTVDAAALADARVEAWLPVAAARDVSLHRRGGASAPVRATAGAVDHALDALIDNAVKFAGAGCTVTVDVRDARGWVEIDVVDDGPGLPPDELALATGAFWRAPAVQNVAGSGLGLPIVASLMRASQGTLELRANQPRGLRVRLRLPAAGSPATNGPAATAHSPGTGGSGSSPAAAGKSETRSPVAGSLQ